MNDDMRLTPKGAYSMAKYYWSADGAIETVQVRDIVLEEDCVCYHCDTPVSAGSKAVELTDVDGDVYVIHTKCAQRSVDR